MEPSTIVLNFLSYADKILALKTIGMLSDEQWEQVVNAAEMIVNHESTLTFDKK